MDWQAPITEHVLELRHRLMWSAIAVLVTTGIAFAFDQQILTFLMAPAQGFGDIPTKSRSTGTLPSSSG